MTFFDLMRNALLAGFGMQEKVREFVDELVKKGELSESQGAKLVKEWTEKAEKGSEQFGKNIEEFSASFSSVIAKTLEKMNLPSRESIENLSKKVEDLAERVDSLEGKGSQRRE